MPTTKRVRYVGPSPARNVPGVGHMVRGEWKEAETEVCDQLAASETGWFEVEKKSKAKEGDQ